MHVKGGRGGFVYVNILVLYIESAWQVVLSLDAKTNLLICEPRDWQNIRFRSLRTNYSKAAYSSHMNPPPHPTPNITVELDISLTVHHELTKY